MDDGSRPSPAPAISAAFVPELASPYASLFSSEWVDNARQPRGCTMLGRKAFDVSRKRQLCRDVSSAPTMCLQAGPVRSERAVAVDNCRAVAKETPSPRTSQDPVLCQSLPSSLPDLLSMLNGSNCPGRNHRVFKSNAANAGMHAMNLLRTVYPCLSGERRLSHFLQP
jgi:hypothetical protein